ncbi:hypothetical protein LR48_Vigan03g101100 [Vigna angularis]|uniref:Uncharacterized protein n=1 Tax=Phaseolus angularis TaxID=3914 RepID=A0A0L9U5D0_PHAAN|nr:uncharacterized protein HKW66_Vig0116250 [Vigna angularis]KOM37629.1 hypothetical protein LR48_Vigan03g101100 [Vigna angularis]
MTSCRMTFSFLPVKKLPTTITVPSQVPSPPNAPPPRRDGGTQESWTRARSTRSGAVRRGCERGGGRGGDEYEEDSGDDDSEDDEEESLLTEHVVNQASDGEPGFVGLWRVGVIDGLGLMPSENQF